MIICHNVFSKKMKKRSWAFTQTLFIFRLFKILKSGCIILFPFLTNHNIELTACNIKYIHCIYISCVAKSHNLTNYHARKKTEREKKMTCLNTQQFLPPHFNLRLEKVHGCNLIYGKMKKRG